jgi:hypothetical protein
MEELTVRLPKHLLFEFLRQIPRKELDMLIQEIPGKSQLEPVRVPSQSLDKLTGLISVGGDALQDTEAIYE